MVVRDRPVRRAISGIGSFSHRAMRRMTFKSPMWITPMPPVAHRARRKGHMGQISVEIRRQPGSVQRRDQQLRFPP